MAEEVEPFSESGETEVAIPGTGELVDLKDGISCAQALDALRDHESQVSEAKRILQRAIAEYAQAQGALSFELPDGRTAHITVSPEITYDAPAIEQALREAGMPEERISEIVEETVTHRIKAVEAKRAARANPEYAKIIADHKTERPRNPSVTIRR